MPLELFLLMYSVAVESIPFLASSDYLQFFQNEENICLVQFPEKGGTNLMCLVTSNCSEALDDLTIVVASSNSLPLSVPLSHAP